MQILEVVNLCLATMGERPLPSLSTPHRFLEAAKQSLDTKRRILLARGWWFNTESATLQPNQTTGEITLGGDIMGVLPGSCESQYVMRGNRLYDTSVGSYEIGKELSATVVRSIAFEDIPESAAQYIAAEAVLQFQTDYDGDSDKRRRIMETRDAARILAEADNTRYAQVNLLDSNIRLQRIKARMRRRIY